MLRSIISSAALRQVLVDVRDPVGRYRDLEVAHVSVDGAVEDALLGHLSGQHDPADVDALQQILERGREEHAVAGLEHEHVVVGGEHGLHQVGMPAVERRAHQLLRGCVPVAVVVVHPHDRHLPVARALDQCRDLRDRRAHALGKAVGVVVLVGVQHVDHEQRGPVAAGRVLSQPSLLAFRPGTFLELLLQVLGLLGSAGVCLGVLLGLRVARGAPLRLFRSCSERRSSVISGASPLLKSRASRFRRSLSPI